MNIWAIAGVSVAAWWFFKSKPAAKPAASVVVKTPKASATATTSSKGTTVNVTIPSLQKKSETLVYGAELTPAEQSNLDSMSSDMLAVEGLVTLHKAYAQAIASKLAASGDMRAVAINYRVANWSKAVTEIPTDALPVIANPINYTFDQIFELASTSDSQQFKQWAAQLLTENNRAEQASILRGQIAAK